MTYPFAALYHENYGKSNVLNPTRYYFINKQLHLRLCHSHKLLVYFPLIQKFSYCHKPYFLLIPPKLCDPIIYEPGKQLIVAYPAGSFFDSVSSDSTYLFVPLNIASIMASLYAESSSGEVSNSTSSSLRSSFLLPLFFRL